MNTVVAKFGGSALSDAKQIRKVVRIIKSNPNMKNIVVSAPEGTTNLLYQLHETAAGTPLFKQTFLQIREVFLEIASGLGLRFNMGPHLKILSRQAANCNLDYVVSRGEFFMANMMAELLGYKFVDAENIIRFNHAGDLDMEASEEKSFLLHDAQGSVIPGFYGATPHGKIKLLPRDGSDITGAIVARLVGTKIYEKWTRGVPGVCMADPKIVSGAKKIEKITYREIRELSYSGAGILQDSVIPLLQHIGVRIHVRNTEESENTGTLIFPDTEIFDRKPGFVGMAGRKDFVVFTLTKMLMNNEVGFLRRVCEVFESFKVNIEHTPWGIDSWIVLAESGVLADKTGPLTEALERECRPDRMTINSNRALICLVGRDLDKSLIFTALRSEDIKVRMFGFDEENDISTIVGVDNDDYERATRAIYNAFVK